MGWFISILLQSSDLLVGGVGRRLWDGDLIFGVIWNYVIIFKFWVPIPSYFLILVV